jgi:hypothetical protein
MSTTSASSPRTRLVWLGAALLAAVGLLAWQLAREASRASLRLPLYDFSAFWAASRLNQTGCDPYDPAALEPLQRQAEPGSDGVLVMWPAPWALGVLRPFGALESHTAHLLWLVCQLGILFWAADRLWLHLGGSRDLRWCGWLLAFTFLPSQLVLITGQLGPLMLLGLVGFLVCVRQRRDVAAGACLALTAFKPQITWLFWLALLIWVVREKRWRVLAGGILGTAALLAVPLWENPHLPMQYWQALTQRTRTHSHLSPLPGTALWVLLDRRWGWLPFVPVLPGLAWLLWYCRRHAGDWNWDRRLPALLFASFLTAPYGAWPFDLVLLLPALFQAALALRDSSSRTRLLALACYAGINLIVLVQLLSNSAYFWFLWLTPALTVLYLGSCRSSVEHQPSCA